VEILPRGGLHVVFHNSGIGAMFVRKHCVGMFDVCDARTEVNLRCLKNGPLRTVRQRPVRRANEGCLFLLD